MSATTPCRLALERAGHDVTPSELLSRVRAWPRVAWQLRCRGVELRCLDGETQGDLENRLGTQLMALFRDARTEESFEALYAFSRPAVLLWIKSLLRRGLEHLDPLELLQDTFVNVYRYPGAFREDHRGSFRVWVRTIAGNIVRRAKMRAGAVSFQELPEGLREPPDLTSNPEVRAALGEQSENLRAAWLLFLSLYHDAYSQLGARDREALRLVEIEGLTYAQAGRVLRVGPSNMKMIIFRSRKRIQARMRAALVASRVGPLRLAG